MLQLETAADLAIARRGDVARHCANPWFSAIVVARGSQLLFERHAADFPRDQPHSIMSISKTVMMLEIERLWAAGMRLGGGPEICSQQFMATIGLAPGACDCVNRTGVCM